MKCKENNCKSSFKIESAYDWKVVFKPDKIWRDQKACDYIGIICRCSKKDGRYYCFIELKDEKVHDLKSIVEKFQNSADRFFSNETINYLSNDSSKTVFLLKHQGINANAFKKAEKDMRVKIGDASRMIETARCSEGFYPGFSSLKIVL